MTQPDLKNDIELENAHKGDVPELNIRRRGRLRWLRHAAVLITFTFVMIATNHAEAFVRVMPFLAEPHVSVNAAFISVTDPAQSGYRHSVIIKGFANLDKQERKEAISGAIFVFGCLIIITYLAVKV